MQFDGEKIFKPGSPYRLVVVKPPKVALPSTHHSYMWLLEALEAFRESGWQEIGLQYTKSGGMIIAYRRTE